MLKIFKIGRLDAKLQEPRPGMWSKCSGGLHANLMAQYIVSALPLMNIEIYADKML